MKRNTRILSLIMAMLTVLAVCNLPVATLDVLDEHGAQPTDWWHNHATNSFAGGSGTQTDPYEIATNGQFAYFAVYLESGALNGKAERTYFRLTEDLDLSAYQWRPIGSTSSAANYSDNTLYNAELDGNGKTVSGVKLTASEAISNFRYSNGCALFARIDDSSITNLSLEVKILDPVLSVSGLPSGTDNGKSINNAQSAVASLVGCTYGTSLIANVTATVDLDVRNVGGAYAYAGLVAVTSEASKGPTLENCTVNGDITIDAYGDFNNGTNGLVTANQTSIYVGGVLGYYQAAGIYDLTNNATVNIIASRGNSYIGGVVGNTYNGLTGENLRNTGKLTVEVATDGYTYIGGVIGGFARSSFLKAPVVNEGDIEITTHNTAIRAGGVVGSAKNASTVMDDWQNKGDITVNKTKAANVSEVGGIVAYVEKASIQISNCSNSGKISFHSQKGFETLHLGGIAANNKIGASITSCTNYGDIHTDIATNTANKTVYTGGIVAQQIGGTVSNCKNLGSLQIHAHGSLYSGGIVGEITATAVGASLTDCYNAGSIQNSGATSNDAAAGIVARTASTKTTVDGKISIKNCVNVGNISHSSLSGGVVGYMAACGYNESTDSLDYDGDGDTTETVNIIVPYAVTMENCVGYGSGVDYALVGSVRVTSAVFKNCFVNTDYAVSYYNQSRAYYDEFGTHPILSINGISLEGQTIPYNPTSVAHIEVGTLEKARVRLDASATENSGIRFDSYITRRSYSELSNLTGVTVSLGTIIAPTAFLSHASVANEYNKRAALEALAGTNGTTYADLPYTEDFLDGRQIAVPNPERNYYFCASLNQIKETNYELKFSAIAYVTVTVGTFSFTAYADFDPQNPDRARSISQIATAAFEDRATEKNDRYCFSVTEENSCAVGGWSMYSNKQLSMLKAFCNYVGEEDDLDTPHIGRHPLASYKIVYAQSPIYKSVGSNTGKTVYGDLGDLLMGAAYDYDYQTAMRLHDLLYEKFGVDLPVVEDANTAIGELEILIGATNRIQSQSVVIEYLGAEEFVFDFTDRKLVICGGSYGATWHAIDPLEKQLAVLTDRSQNLKGIGNLSGTCDLILVAATGDSVLRGSQAIPDGSSATADSLSKKAGSAATNVYIEQFLSYPAVLQRIFWKDYVFYNYGKGNASMLDYSPNLEDPSSGPYYLNHTSKFRALVNHSNQEDVSFDLLILQLGGNDSTKIGSTWSQAKKDEFKTETKKLIDEVLVGSPNAKILYMNVPHRAVSPSTARAIRSAAMRAVQKEILTALKAEGYDLYHYDLASMMKRYLSTDPSREGIDDATETALHRPYYNIENEANSPDTTHPNHLGYYTIGNNLVPLMQYLFENGPKPEYMIDIG